MSILIFAAGLIVGSIYHAYVRPVVVRAWDWIKAKFTKGE